MINLDGRERLDLFEDIAAADEVHVTVRMRAILHRAADDLDALLESVRCHCRTGALHVDGDWFYANTRHVVCLDQADQMRTVPTIRIQDH